MNSQFNNTEKQFVLIVGASPSFANVDQFIVFKGTKSGDVLDKWLIGLGVQNGSIINASDHYQTTRLRDANVKNLEDIFKAKPIDKVIALGNYASKVLTKLKIEHFLLPHPSLRNRQHNDPEFIKLKLEACRGYLYPETKQYE